VSIAPFNSAQGTVFTAIIRDISVRKKIEETQRQLIETSASIASENRRLYQDARKAIRAKDDMMAIVSHDLKNPLTSILLNIELLKRQFPEETMDGIIGKGLFRAEQSAKKCSNLVHDILDLGKIESGCFKVIKQGLNIYTVLTEVTNVMNPLAEKKSIQLKTILDEDILQVHCDRDRIYQVLSNLISNAVKFTPENGLIRVTVRNLEHGIQFSVSDTGCGIPKDDLPQLFERYWQAEAAAKLGTGLGLYIAKNIVESHGGQIWAESEPNLGSTFSFILPHLVEQNEFSTELNLSLKTSQLEHVDLLGFLH